MGEDIGLEAAGRALTQIAVKGRILQKVAQVAGGRGIGLAGAAFGIDGERVAGTGHGHVKQAPLLLFVEGFVVFRHYRFGIAEFAGKFHQGLPVGRGKRSRIGSKNDNVVEFEALGGVSGHQTDGVNLGRRHGNGAAGLAKVVEVFEQFGNLTATGDGLSFPLGNELENGGQSG